MLLRGGTIVDAGGSRRGDVLVEGELITEVGEGLQPRGGDVLDVDGAYVIPGGVDVHTHLALPVGGVRSADDFESGTRSAACGGTTCVIDFAGAGREPWEEALETWHARARGRAVVDYGFHLTVTELPEDPDAARARFARFTAHGVSSVKLYMAYPDRLMVDDATLLHALAAGRATGVRVCVHAEDGAAIERRATAALAAGSRGPEAIPYVRPPAVEAAAIARAAALAREAAASLYVVHLSSKKGLEAIRAARAAGTDIHVETCPHYLFLDRRRLTDGSQEAQDFTCAPPLRAAADRKALWAALAAGEIDLVSTDHCPFTCLDRRRGTLEGAAGWADFRQIPGGLPGLETRIALLYQAVRDGRLGLERWVELIAGAPASLFGLGHRKGAIRPGLDADLVVFDPTASRRLGAAALHSQADHCPYEGMEVTGWPALTIARGRIVATAGEPADAEPGWGRFVVRLPRQPEVKSDGGRRGGAGAGAGARRRPRPGTGTAPGRRGRAA